MNCTERGRADTIKSSAHRPDLLFFWLVLFLLGIGLLMLLSASFPSAFYEMGTPYYYFIRQGRFALMGLAMMICIAFSDYHVLRKIAKPLLAVTGVLLIMVLIPSIGIVRNNARRWLSLAGIQFQPSELAKLVLILNLAAGIARKREKMLTARQGIFPYLLLTGVLAILVGVQPHLSGAVLIAGTGAILMFVGGIHPLHALGGSFLAVGGAAVILSGVLPYGKSRIAMWHDPFADAEEAGYQLSQSFIAIGSGGWTGLGLGKSRQKFMYLPEEHNDFIFSIVCEELGLMGACLILLLFAAVVLRGYSIALKAGDRFGALLVVGIISLFAMQTFLNISVVTGLLPTTGISLPFFSYGGTALILQLAEMGIVLSVSRGTLERKIHPLNCK